MALTTYLYKSNLYVGPLTSMVPPATPPTVAGVTPSSVNVTIDSASKASTDDAMAALGYVYVDQQTPVISATVTTQPGAPAPGDGYLLPVGAIGADWAGNDNSIAIWTGAVWTFAPPVVGWCVTATDTGLEYYWNGTSWGPPTDELGGDLTGTLLAAETARINGGTSPATPVLADVGKAIVVTAAGVYSLGFPQITTDNNIPLGTALLRAASLFLSTTTGIGWYAAAGDANPVAKIATASAGLQFGAGGGTALDTALRRSAANILEMLATTFQPAADNALAIGTAALRLASFNGVLFRVYGAASDANSSAQLSDKALKLGAGGGTALDTRITRSAATTLTIDDGAAGAVTVLPGANNVGAIGSSAQLWATIRGTLVVGGSLQIADANSITPTAGANLFWQANTQAIGTLTINAPTGAPVEGQKLIIRIKSTNVQTYAWNGIFRATVGQALPTVSAGAGNTNYIGFIFNAQDTKWDCVASV